MLRLRPGARATLDDVTFTNNTVATGNLDAVAAGPVMGMYDRLDDGGSEGPAAWFHNCTFGEQTSTAPGAVAVESSACRVYVYSNTGATLPAVWDRDLRRKVDVWRLTLSPEARADPDAIDVFADVEVGPDFLRPSDDLFQRIIANQAEVAGLAPARIRGLPDGTRLTAKDPYSSENLGSVERVPGDGSKSAQRSEGWRIGLIAGLGGAALLVTLATILAIRRIRLRRKSAAERGDTEVCATS